MDTRHFRVRRYNGIPVMATTRIDCWVQMSARPLDKSGGLFYISVEFDIVGVSGKLKIIGFCMGKSTGQKLFTYKTLCRSKILMSLIHRKR
jgi:hypothetical protein